MLNFLSKLLMFYFAYLPLVIILLLQNMNLGWSLLVISVVLLVIGFISINLLFKTIKTVAPKNEKVELISNKNSESLSFIVTYILPFIGDFRTINDWLAFGILFLIISYLYLDTSLFCINPLLKIFFKYNIYLVNFNKEEYYLLSKKTYSKGEYPIDLIFLTNDLVMED